MSPPKPSSTTRIPLKILMLHGYTQSGPLFRSKTRALHKALTKSLPKYEIQLSYPTGPIRLDPADIPGYNTLPENNDDEEPEPAYGWWRRKDMPHPMQEGETEILYTGLQDGLTVIGETLKTSGPFDGIIGFSQGACAAAMVASLLEPGRRGVFVNAALEGKALMERFPAIFRDVQKEPFKFAIIYSGFLAPNKLRYGNFYEPRLKTRTCHFLGSMDGVVEEGRSRALVERCEGANVVVHPGGHFLPSQRPWLDAAVGFVGECMQEVGDGGGGKAEGKGEEQGSVEDMDVPF